MLAFALLLCIGVPAPLYAIGDSLSVSASYFFTYGDYNSHKLSRSHAAYTTAGFYSKYFITAGYEDLLIDTADWNYRQRTFSASFSSGTYPLFYSAAYMRIDGGLHAKTYTYDTDEAYNIYSAGSTYFLSYIMAAGLDFTILLQKGYKDLSIYQMQGKADYYWGWDWYFSLRPALHHIAGGNTYASFSAKVHYLAASGLVLKGAGFVGSRRYFFDPELLVVFNQDEVQRNLMSIQVDYQLNNSIKLMAAAQRTSFQGYNIRYYIAGIKAQL